MKKFNLYKKTPIYFLIITVLFLSSCELFNDDNDTSDQLPEATQTGENTFGCLINGKPFVVTNTSQQTAIYQQGQLQFGVNIGVGNNDETIAFNLVNPLMVGESYNLTENDYKAGYTKRIGDKICIYQFEKTFEGSIIFTKIDLNNYIISGRFSFSTKKIGCEDIKITDGVFDLKYIP